MITVELRLPDGTSRPVDLPAPGSADAPAPGPCPACARTPWRVRGTGIETEGVSQGQRIVERIHRARAVAVCCGAEVGAIVAHERRRTLFGYAEDDAVLHGRPRVYDGGGS